MAEKKNDQRPRRKRQIGIVTSDRMNKTIVVRVDWLYEVPKYGKRVRRHTKYYAHDEHNVARIGDEVEIIACRPLSKLKRWRLVRVIRRAGEKTTPAEQPADRGNAAGAQPSQNDSMGATP